jgi:predicted AAA+ superfamily ATPase
VHYNEIRATFLSMLHDVILSQQREWEGILARSYISRTSVEALDSEDLARVVIGPRRAGKSFYAAHLAGKDATRCGYLNFDDDRLAGITDTDAITAALDTVYGSPDLLLFDEIQNRPNWELWVNRLQRNGRKLILTGSNAHLLSSELATHLTGRHLSIPLLPFSFAEYLSATAPNATLTRSEFSEACRTYSRIGGFPEVVLKALSGPEYLRTLVAAVIHKDIVVRHHIRAPQALDATAFCLLSQPGGSYSFRRLMEATECKSIHTLKKYVGFLEQAFLLFTVPRFSFKPREQASSAKKAYPIDNGLVTASSFQSSRNHGRLMESLVAIASFRQQLQGKHRLYYWQDPQKSEVDFVLYAGNAVQTLIQVCVDPESPKALEREIRGLLKASRDLRCGNLLLLTESDAGESLETWQGHSAIIRRQPIWEWLLQQG